MVEPTPAQPQARSFNQATTDGRTQTSAASQRPAAQPAQTGAPPSVGNNNQPPTTSPPDQERPTSAFEESEVFPGQYKPVPEETVLEWQAPARPFKKRNRQFYTTVTIITLLISLILFFAGQFLPIAVVISVAFLAYVMSSVPPEMVTNKITTYGVRNEGNLYYWDELGRFWFEDKLGSKTLQIETARFPNRIVLLLGDKSELETSQLLSEVLIQEKPAETYFDKAAKWLQNKVPLEAS